MKTLITRIKRLALALCFVTPLVSWAATEMTNPVTGETETYVNTFTGKNTSEWNAAGNWDTANVPYIQNGVYTSALIDGKTASTASASIDGWALQVGAYNDAAVMWKSLGKIQGDSTMWLTVDSTSSITINGWGGGNLGQSGKNLNYYVAANNGVTWSVDFASGTDQGLTMNYYLAKNGSVSYKALGKATHVIKQADVTLSGTSQVSSKTLVSFTSSSTTFMADAAIKVYDTDGTTLKETVAVTSVRSSGAAIQNTTSALTADDAVGTCELVQCTDGIVLYYVDGDPSAVVAKTYNPSININFTSGTALSTPADVGVGDYAVPGTSWNNLIGNNGTLSTVTQVDSTGAASTVAGVGVTISGTRGYWTCGSVTAATDLRQGYIDDAAGANASPQVVVSGIPYYSYYAVVYFSNNGDNVKFGYVTINGTNYKWDDTTSALVECEGADTDSWGASSPTAWTEGGNYIVTPTIVNADGTFTVVGHRLTSARAGIAAIQIVEVPKQAADGELVINVSGDTTYPVSENATYTTVYVTGVGTLAFSGEGTITTTTLNVGAGATVPMGSSIAPTTVTGAGTVVYDGVQPSTTLGFNDSDKWFGTVWVKNVGDTSRGEATDAKVTTCLGSNTTDASSNDLNKWGNANSFVKFTNVRGYMARTSVPWTLILEDDSSNYAWYNNEGWSARSITIAGLKGDGTFWDINDGGCRPFLNFGDASQFTGTIKALGKQVFLNDTTNTGDASSGLSGRITVPANQTLTVASGKTWHTRNGLVVNGTLNVNGTLASESTTSAVSGSGTVVFTGSAPSPTGDAWWKNSAWTGTVQMKSVTLVGTDLAFNDYGNTGSVLELNGCSGWLTPAYTCTVPLKITGTLSLTNGYSGKNNAFKVGTLLGDGTISGSSSAPTMVFNVTDDCSNFTGKVQLTNKCVVFGSSIPDSLTEGRIYIAEGAQVTVQNTAEAGWWGVGGIQVDGELRANSLDRFGGGTNITTSDNGVFTLTSTGNGTEGETDTDYARIKGTGSLKYAGTGWRALTTNNLSTAVTLVNEQSGDILLSRALTYTIGSLSGSKKFQGNYGSGSRYLNIVQTKDTEWSGTITTDNSSRLAGFSLDATSTGTLTLSGTETQSATLAVNGGSVNLTGTWVGATTVAGTFGGIGTLTGDLTFSEGATFKVFAADDADGLVVSGTVGYPAEGTVTVDVSAIEPETDVALIKAADLNRDKFVLADGTPEGYSLDVVDGVLTLTVPHVTITVPAIANTTVTVKIGDNTIGTSSGEYNVAPDSVVTVTYAAVDGYEISGTTEYTIDTSKSETTFDPAESTEVKQYVASITAGETTTKYTTLQAAIDAVAQNKDIVLLANEADGATVSREITFYVVPGEYTYGDIAAGGDYILTTTALEGRTRYSLAPAVIAVTINDVRTLYSMINAPSGMEAANAGPIGTTIEILSGNPQDYVDYLPMFDLNTDTGVFTKVANPVAAVYEGVIQQQVYRTLADAVTAATSGQTVKLLADVALTGANDAVVFPATFDGTLDLNGHSIQRLANSYYVLDIVNGAKVTITDSSTGGAGMVKGTPVASGKVKSPASMIRVKGKLTLESGTLVSDYCCVKVDEDPGVGEFVMNGGTVEIIANEQGYTGLTFTIMNWGVATVNGGTHKGNVQSLSYSGNNASKASTLTINGGSFDPANIYMLAYDTDYAPTVKIAKTITNLTVVNASSTALGYVVSGPVEEGNYNVYTLAVPSGIDPTDPESKQDVVVDPTGKTEAEIKEAAIAEAAVTVPAGVSGVDAATYKTYFNYTVTDKGNGVYEVAVDQTKDLKEEVVLPEEVTVGEKTISQAEEVLEAVTTDATNATVPAVAGIYYSLVAADNLNFTEAVEGTQTLATGATVTISKPAQLPSGTAVFFRVKASATPNNN